MQKIRNAAVLLTAAFFAVLVIPCYTTNAQAQAIELTYGTPYGIDHTFSMADKKWMEKVEKESKGKVKFKPYWGGTLLSSRDGVEEVTKGVVSIGCVMPSYTKAGYPIHKASYFFYYGANQKTGLRALKETIKKFPEIEKEYQGLKVLAWTSGAQYQIGSIKPIRKMEDMKGMRIKVTGDFAAIFKALGAEGVNVPITETYVSMQKGLMDAGWISFEALKTLRLAEVCKYVLVTDFYRTHGGSRAMNLEQYNKLPSDLKKVLDNNIDFWGRENDDEFARNDVIGVEFAKGLKVEFITPSKEEMDKFYKPLVEFAAIKAKELDGQGLPGTKIWNEAQRLVKLYNK